MNCQLGAFVIFVGCVAQYAFVRALASPGKAEKVSYLKPRRAAGNLDPDGSMVQFGIRRLPMILCINSIFVEKGLVQEYYTRNF